MDFFKSYKRAVNDICSDYSLSYPTDSDLAIKALLEDQLSQGWTFVSVSEVVNWGTVWIFRATGRNS